MHRTFLFQKMTRNFFSRELFFCFVFHRNLKIYRFFCKLTIIRRHYVDLLEFENKNAWKNVVEMDDNDDINLFFFLKSEESIFSRGRKSKSSECYTAATLRGKKGFDFCINHINVNIVRLFF